MTTLWMFGSSADGQLGFGGCENVPKPLKISFFSERNLIVSDFAFGKNHSIALVENDLYSWGNNDFQQLGHNNRRMTPSKVDFSSVFTSDKNFTFSAKSVNCAQEYSVAIDIIGRVLIWGNHGLDNFKHSDGDTKMENFSMRLVKLPKKNLQVVQIATGFNHTMLLCSDSSIWGFGDNSRGQIGISNSDNLDNCFVSIPTQVKSLNSNYIKKITCGGYHTGAITQTGKLFMWGSNSFGQLGLSDTVDRLQPALVTALIQTKIVDISCGEDHSAAVTSTGQLYLFGSGSHGQNGDSGNLTTPKVFIDLMGNIVRSVKCGRRHTIVIIEDNNLFSLGLNASGQCGIGKFSNKEATTRLYLQDFDSNRKKMTVETGVSDQTVIMECYEENEKTEEDILKIISKRKGKMVESASVITEKIQKLELTSNLPDSIQLSFIKKIVMIINSEEESTNEFLYLKQLTKNVFSSLACINASFHNEDFEQKPSLQEIKIFWDLIRSLKSTMSNEIINGISESLIECMQNSFQTDSRSVKASKPNQGSEKSIKHLEESVIGIFVLFECPFWRHPAKNEKLCCEMIKAMARMTKDQWNFIRKIWANSGRNILLSISANSSHDLLGSVIDKLVVKLKISDSEIESNGHVNSKFNRLCCELMRLNLLNDSLFLLNYAKAVHSVNSLLELQIDSNKMDDEQGIKEVQSTIVVMETLWKTNALNLKVLLNFVISTIKLRIIFIQRSRLSILSNSESNSPTKSTYEVINPSVEISEFAETCVVGLGDVAETGKGSLVGSGSDSSDEIVDDFKYLNDFSGLADKKSGASPPLSRPPSRITLIPNSHFYNHAVSRNINIVSDFSAFSESISSSSSSAGLLQFPYLAGVATSQSMSESSFRSFTGPNGLGGAIFSVPVSGGSVPTSIGSSILSRFMQFLNQNDDQNNFMSVRELANERSSTHSNLEVISSQSGSNEFPIRGNSLNPITMGFLNQYFSPSEGTSSNTGVSLPAILNSNSTSIPLRSQILPTLRDLSQSPQTPQLPVGAQISYGPPEINEHGARFEVTYSLNVPMSFRGTSSRDNSVDFGFRFGMGTRPRNSNGSNQEGEFSNQDTEAYETSSIANDTRTSISDFTDMIMGQLAHSFGLNSDTYMETSTSENTEGPQELTGSSQYHLSDEITDSDSSENEFQYNNPPRSEEQARKKVIANLRKEYKLYFTKHTFLLDFPAKSVLFQVISQRKIFLHQMAALMAGITSSNPNFGDMNFFNVRVRRLFTFPGLDVSEIRDDDSPNATIGISGNVRCVTSPFLRDTAKGLGVVRSLKKQDEMLMDDMAINSRVDDEQQDLSKPLRIHFDNELGVDQGGVRNEFVMMFFAEMLKCTDLFTEIEQTELVPVCKIDPMFVDTLIAVRGGFKDKPEATILRQILSIEDSTVDDEKYNIRRPPCGKNHPGHENCCCEIHCSKIVANDFTLSTPTPSTVTLSTNYVWFNPCPSIAICGMDDEYLLKHATEDLRVSSVNERLAELNQSSVFTYETNPSELPRKVTIDTPSNLVLDSYRLIGRILGVALFNKCLCALSFLPPVLFHKLCGWPVTLDHLKVLNPQLANGLQMLLDHNEQVYIDDNGVECKSSPVEDVFGLNFTVVQRVVTRVTVADMSVLDYELPEKSESSKKRKAVRDFGKRVLKFPKNENESVQQKDQLREDKKVVIPKEKLNVQFIEFELIPGGADKLVSSSNRKDYVDAYVKWILEDSVKPGFDALKTGIEEVCSAHSLRMFSPLELERMMRGAQSFDFADLERVTRYRSPYHLGHPVVRRFWSVVHSFTPEQKREFLRFVTGSDRVPSIRGLRGIPLLIQPSGGSGEEPATSETPETETEIDVIGTDDNYTSTSISTETAVRRSIRLAQRTTSSASTTSTESIALTEISNRGDSPQRMQLQQNQLHNFIQEDSGLRRSHRVLSRTQTSENIEEHEVELENRDVKMGASLEETQMRLPSAHTCSHVLDLPPYNSEEKLREKLVYAMLHGSGGFHLV
ncbi:hypothetical protein HK096_003392 [Nowakowskiella sp. JEL0078]|nr:hypothetical protein HK096_003392 [Nowakowskiella sp. JEL0078]